MRPGTRPASVRTGSHGQRGETAMSNTQWYIEREGVEYGPCNWEGLQTLAREGTLRMTDLVRREGDTYWVPAHQARCDAPAISATASPQPAAAAAQPAAVTARKQI